MYSPKISEEMVPVLYRIAKDKGISMVQLVNSIIADTVKGINVEAKMVVSETKEVFVVTGENVSS